MIAKAKAPPPPTVYDEAALRGCTRCVLAEHRTHVVLGEGPLDARLVILGEAPGREEDEAGHPFIGASGKLITQLLDDVGIDRKQAYISNTVKCRPTVLVDGKRLNAPPKAEHLRACDAWLRLELARLDPDVIVLLGAKAARAVVGADDTVESLRGRTVTPEVLTRSGVRAVPTIVTYHPAATFKNFAGTMPLLQLDLARAAALLRGVTPDTTPLPTYDVCLTVAEVAAFVDAAIAHGGPIAFDTECGGNGDGAALDYRAMEVLCVGFSLDPGHATVIPFQGQFPRDQWDRETGRYRQPPPRVWEPEEEAQVIAHLQRLFSSDACFTGQNAKYDRHALDTLGIVTRATEFDTMHTAYLVDENSPHNLDYLRESYTTLPFYEAWKHDPAILPRQGASYALVPSRMLWAYLAADTDTTLRATPPLMRRLQDEGPGVRWVSRHITMPLADAVYRLECQGMLVDRARMLDLQAEYQRRIAAAEADLREQAGRFINDRSPKQLRQLFFEELSMTSTKSTKGGQRSLDREVLTDFAVRYPDVPAVQSLLLLRKLRRTRDMYLAGEDGVSGLMAHLDADGYVRTQYNVSRAVTGRLACLPAGTRIATDRGDISIALVQAGDRIATRTGPRTVRDVWLSGVAPVIEATTTHGYRVRATATHRFMVLAPDGTVDYRALGDMRVGDALYLAPPSVFGPHSLPRAQAEALGYFRLDGGLYRAAARKTGEDGLRAHLDFHDVSDFEIEAALVTTLQDWGLPLQRADHPARPITASWGNGYMMGQSHHYRTATLSRDAMLRCHAIGMPVGRKRGQLHGLPSFLFSLDRATTAAYLRGVFEADGTALRGRVVLAQTDRRLLEDVHYLLTKFGVFAHLRPDAARPSRWLLVIQADIRQFLSEIGFISATKRERVRAGLVEDARNGHVFSGLTTLGAAFRQRGSADLASYNLAIRMARGDAVGVPALVRHVLRHPDDAALSALLDLNVVQDTITATRVLPPEPVYDLQMDGDPSYVAESFVVHNSEKPNLHNITKKDADDDDAAEDTVRSLFVAPPGYLLVESDYQQLEIRLQGYICNEQVLLDLMDAPDFDKHRLTAALINNIPLDQVTKHQRQIGKTSNFATGYQGGPKAVAKASGVDIDTAKDIIEKLTIGYPATAAKQEAARELLEDYGFVQNRFGRRRRFPTYRMLRGQMKGLRFGDAAWWPLRDTTSRMERQAYNFWIQSTGSDILSLATIDTVLGRTEEARELLALGAVCCLTLHDALYWYVPERHIDRAVVLIRAIMEGVTIRYGDGRDMAHWRLPVDISIAYRWGQPIKTFRGVARQ